MTNLRRDDEPASPVLREAYDRERETLEPSPLLWRRLRAALLADGLLRARRPAWRWAGVAAAIAVVAFLGGFATGISAARKTPTARPTALPTATSLHASTSPSVAAERVQATGTAYSAALDALAHSLVGASGSEIDNGVQVVLATQNAQSDARKLFLGGSRHHEANLEPAGNGRMPVIWF